MGSMAIQSEGHEEKIVASPGRPTPTAAPGRALTQVAAPGISSVALGDLRSPGSPG